MKHHLGGQVVDSPLNADLGHSRRSHQRLVIGQREMGRPLNRSDHVSPCSTHYQVGKRIYEFRFF